MAGGRAGAAAVLPLRARGAPTTASPSTSRWPAQPGAGRRAVLAGARPARGPRRRAAPLAAQAAAGELRAGAEPRTGLPGRGPAGPGAAARRARAAPPVAHRRVCLATPGTGTRCRRTCGPTYRVVAEDGAVVATGKDLPRSRSRCAGRFADALTDAAAEQTAHRPASWTFGDRRAVLRADARRAPGQGLPRPRRRGQHGRAAGVRRRGGPGGRPPARRAPAARPDLPSPAARLTEGWDNRRKLALAGSPYPSVAELLDDCVLAAVELLDGPARRSGVGRGGVRRAAGDGRAGARGRRRGTCWRTPYACSRLAGDRPARCPARSTCVLLPAMTDMRAQVGRLVGRGFVADAGAEQLRHLPRYLAAVRARREKLAGRPAPRPDADGPGGPAAGGLPAPGGGAARGPAASRWPCGGCGGCSRSTASACGPSSSARRCRSPTPGSARRSAAV